MFSINVSSAVKRGTQAAASTTSSVLNKSAEAAAVAASSEAYDENGRVMIFSGMIGGEVVALVDLWRTTGMDDTLFACLVPNNENSDVAGLVSEIADDHREMLAKVAAEREGK